MHSLLVVVVLALVAATLAQTQPYQFFGSTYATALWGWQSQVYGMAALNSDYLVAAAWDSSYNMLTLSVIDPDSLAVVGSVGIPTDDSVLSDVWLAVDLSTYDVAVAAISPASTRFSVFNARSLSQMCSYSFDYALSAYPGATTQMFLYNGVLYFSEPSGSLFDWVFGSTNYNFGVLYYGSCYIGSSVQL